MTDEQAQEVAAIEREWGRASSLPLGPRRDRVLKYAGYGAIAVQTEQAWLEPDVFVVEEDGTVEQVPTRAGV